MTKSSITRRRLIKTGATAGAGALLVSGVPDAQAATPGGSALTQTAEGQALTTFTWVPATPAAAPFQAMLNSYPNAGDGSGSYNHAVHLGWNAALHSEGATGVDVTANKPGLIMGFEDSYFDDGGDAHFGAEWYVEYWSPDHTSVQQLRPFYTRIRNDNNTVNSCTTVLAIGSDGTGQFAVRTALGGPGTPLFTVVETGLTAYKTLTMSGANAVIIAPLYLGNSGANKNVVFRAGSASGQFVVQNAATNVNNFVITDAGHIALRDGAVIQNFGTGFRIGGSATQLIGFWGKSPVPRPTGWAAATGGATRTSFATGSVTLSALAEAVKALIDDLRTIGVIGA